MNSLVTQYAAPLFERYPQLHDYLPTLERPFFNISLWEHFDDVVTRVTNGRFVPSEFQFIAGELPLSTLPLCYTPSLPITLLFLVAGFC